MKQSYYNNEEKLKHLKDKYASELKEKNILVNRINDLERQLTDKTINEQKLIDKNSILYDKIKEYKIEKPKISEAYKNKLVEMEKKLKVYESKLKPVGEMMKRKNDDLV